MKTLQIVFIIICIGITNASRAQTKKEISKTEASKDNKDNFLDMGAGTLTQVLGENIDGKSKGKKVSFLELLEKMDMPAVQKAEYRNWYFLQAKNLSEKQKDSLGLAIQKKIMEAKKAN